MARSKKTNLFAKTRKVLNTGLKMLENVYRKGSNGVLNIANKGMSKLKNKSSKRRTKRRKH
jgi:hypothetical protein